MSRINRVIERLDGMPPIRADRALEVSGGRIRAWRSDAKWMFHRQKNGIYDPISYALVIEALLDIQPDEYWMASELAKLLNETQPALVWDAVTVGRIVSDIADTTGEILPRGRRPIERSMVRMGRRYAMTPATDGIALLVAVRNDLRALCEQVIARERAQDELHRFESPLNLCQSLEITLN